MISTRFQILSAVTFLAIAVTCVPAFATPEAFGEAVLTSPKAGQPFDVNYFVIWKGEPDAYVIEPPVPDSIEGWADVHVARAEVRRSGESNQVMFAVSFLSSEPGSKEIPGTTFTYYAPVGEGEDPVKEILFSEGQPVEVVPPTDTRLVILVSVAAALALAAGFVVMRRYWSTAPVGVSGPRDDSYAGTLHAARAHRLDGDYYSFYQELNRAASQLPQGKEVKALRQRLSEQARAVGYQAQVPTPDELDGDLRELERLHVSIEHQDS